MRPGLLFWHTAPSGKKTPQYRPDNPKDGHKYIFPKNSGSVLSVNPTMTAERPIVVIVEGTKQMIFAAAYAPDDARVVGIQGCWAWSSDGQAVTELDELVQGHDVIIIFDADISSNPNVYEAGATLSETLDIIGAKSVRFALIPGGKSVGLDDFLGRRPVGNRSSAFAEILAKGVPLSKLKKPAKRKVTVDAKDATFDFVSRMLGEICVVEYEKRDDNGTLARHQEGRPVAAYFVNVGRRLVAPEEVTLDIDLVEPRSLYAPHDSCSRFVFDRLRESNRAGAPNETGRPPVSLACNGTLRRVGSLNGLGTLCEFGSLSFHGALK